jgi:two-component system, NtrC family, sensor histidine kinase HydH
MYIPALFIVTVVLLLLILIVVSTYLNLDRSRRTTMALLHSEGVNMLHSLEVGAGIGSRDSNKKNIAGILIRELAKSEDIAYIYFFDSKGNIIDHYDPARAGNVVPRPVLSLDPAVPASRVRQFAEGLHVYELTKIFSPLQYDATTPVNNEAFAQNGTVPSNLTDGVIVLGLNMAKFEHAQMSDTHHAMLMASILVALGLGVIFFVFVIQKYYLVDKTLKETQDYTRQVVANMANGLLSVNMAGEVVSFNQLGLNLLELEEKDVTGLDLRKVLDFETAGISETLAGHRSVFDREISFKLRSGEAMPLSISVTPILTENKQINGAVILMRDLREIKRLQEKVRRSEKMAAIGELAAGVAHEIRNPLSSIRGFAQFLHHTLKDRTQESEYAAVMVHEIDRINRVVTDLLTYARPLIVKRTRGDLRELVNHNVSLVEADARAKHVTIRQDLAGEMENVLMDTNQITQAILNLLLNSLEAMPEGGEIEVGAESSETLRRLHLWVEDNGEGIRKENLKKILDPFFTTRDKGTGLGLAIVNKIVENHEGELVIESPPRGKNQGTRVSIYIPLSSPFKKEKDNEAENISRG